MAGVKIYLAARYSRHPEMRVVRDRLEASGHKVVSRWIEGGGTSLQKKAALKQIL